MKTYNKVLFYGAGHSSIDPITKDYITPGKRFNHDGKWFYEGVKNRLVAKLAMENIRKRGIQVVPVFHQWKDTPLSHRTNLANYYHNNIQEGIYFSEHSDSCNGCGAKGFAIWTSPGLTKSDEYATKGIELYENRFGNKESIRKQLKDGDPDYEARFHVLTQTDMPSLLFENKFFCNKEDIKDLNDIYYLEEYAEFQGDLAEIICR